MITATEFHVREPLPLHRVQEAIFEFCRGRDDVIVFGAQAVNLHVDIARMTQDVDLLAPAPTAVAEEMARHLADEFHAAIRVRTLVTGMACRVYQSRKSGNRHLANVRRMEFAVDDPVVQDGVRHVSLPLIAAMKVRALSRRRQSPKGATDLADLRRLLLAHPELREAAGGVEAALDLIGGGEAAVTTWLELLQEPLMSDDDSDEGY